MVLEAVEGTPKKPLESFDPKADRFMDDPFEFYRRLREEAPVYREPRSGIYFVTTYELIEQVVKQPDLFNSGVDRVSMREGGLPARVLEIKAQGWPSVLTMTNNDGPDHAVFRGLITPFFTPRYLKSVEGFVSARSADLIAAIRRKGHCDFLREVAIPLPIAVIARFLGLEGFDVETLKRWSDAFADEIGLLTSEERAVEVAELILECHRTMIAVCNERRARPAEDIISHLVAAEVNGRPLTEPELLSLLTQLFVAGNETTTNILAGGAYRLASDPALFQSLKHNTNLIGNFIEECLRLESPVQGLFRRAARATELAGVPIPKGALIHVRFASGNRDETVFGEHSEDMLLERRQPKPHLAFGSGMHFCIGAMLSRLELRIAFQQLVEECSSLALAEPDTPPRYHTHFHHRGMTAVPLVVG